MILFVVQPIDTDIDTEALESRRSRRGPVTPASLASPAKRSHSAASPITVTASSASKRRGKT